MGFSPFQSLTHRSEVEPVARPLSLVLSKAELDEPEPLKTLRNFQTRGKPGSEEPHLLQSGSEEPHDRPTGFRRT
jgi:hypothetical protein